MAGHQKSSLVKRSLSWPVQDSSTPKNGVTIYTTEGRTALYLKTILPKLQEMDNKLGHLLLEVQEMKSKHPVKKRLAVSRRKKIVRSKKSLNGGLTCDERESHMRCQQQKTQTMGKEGIRYFEEEHKHFLENMFASLLTDYRTREMKRRKSTTVNEVNSVDTKSEMLLDSFMYRDYFNGCPDGRKNVALHPLIATSRNLDDFVAKELSSGTQQSTNHPSEEASRLSSNKSLLLSEGPHSMNLELVRLETFKNFPPSRSVSAIKLAKEGFYYIGQGEDDLVICFACKSQKRGWRDGDIPREIHQQMSPQCPLLNEHSVNVPVGGSLNSLNGNHQQHSNTEQVSETSDIERNNQHSNSEQVNEPSQRTIPQNLSDPQTTEIGRRSEATEAESTVEQSPGNVSGSPTLDRDHLVPASNRNTERSETLSLQNNQSTESHSNPNHKKSRAIQEQINAFLRNLDPLEINYDRAKYHEYAVMATRVSSFQDWPTSLTQTPQVLALAGFFYAGHGDSTRCFFCGGGLRNWEPGDEPWTEHARWFPKCAFVRQYRGDEFVALVQIRHQELETLDAMGEGATAASSVEQGSSVEQNGGLTSGLRQSDITAFPSFQSVLEMGYSESEIREAFNQLKGTKYPEDITGMDLMEVILSKEDRNNGLDIPSPIYSPRPTNGNQSRNPYVDHNTPDVSQGGQLEAAIGPSPHETSESWAQEKTPKNQDKDAATSSTEGKFNSMNDALAPAMSLEGISLR
ncbi:baculoviral IAP repeat-containing protein 2 isoform X5 [Magallana gigas]|uniref:baculoviral IAP repeat-containing protein 2 isoform X5 n=1 Tax=Magallana gigas TaxID=29159 RepID=UPI003342A603